MLTEGDGGPVAVVVAGANVHDTKLLQDTLEAVIVQPPNPVTELKQHLCLDKGYDNPTGHAAAEVFGYIPHIRRIGEEGQMKKKHKNYKPRRWVVERTLGWLNKCRAILVRYAKKSSNYLAVIKLACILLWFRRAHKLGVF